MTIIRFKDKKELVKNIARNHYRFGGHAIEHAAGTIDRLAEILRDNPEITGVTYEAMQKAQGQRSVPRKAQITIGKDENGFWTCIERTQEI